MKKKKDKANKSDDESLIMEPIVIRNNNTLRKHLGRVDDARCEALRSKRASWFVRPFSSTRSLAAGGAIKTSRTLSHAFWFVLLVRPNPWQQVGHQTEHDFVIQEWCPNLGFK